MKIYGEFEVIKIKIGFVFWGHQFLNKVRKICNSVEHFSTY